MSAELDKFVRENPNVFDDETEDHIEVPKDYEYELREDKWEYTIFKIYVDGFEEYIIKINKNLYKNKEDIEEIVNKMFILMKNEY